MEAFCKPCLVGEVETSHISALHRGSLADVVLGLALIITEGCKEEGRWRLIMVLHQVHSNSLLCLSSGAQRGVFRDISVFVLL